MNIQQLQYVLAVAELKHFESAAEKCFITQSTLSTMISKLEDEIGILIFNRSKKPVEITVEGEKIIHQLKLITKEIQVLKEITQEIKGEVKGSLKISVIPTIAPYLLPLFLNKFAQKFPDLNIEIKEQTTSEIIRQIKNRDIDIGIVSTPLKENEILEHHLYDEPFLFYCSQTMKKSKVDIKDLNLNNLFLLEEGHCLRTQILELCTTYEKQIENNLNFKYKAGSIDSLMRFVKSNNGSTLLPYLATLELSPKELKKLKQFIKPVPFRSVGLVVHKHFVKNKLLKSLSESIIFELKKINIPEKLDISQRLNPI